MDWGSSDVVVIKAFCVPELRHGAGGHGPVAKNVRGILKICGISIFLSKNIFYKIIQYIKTKIVHYNNTHPIEDLSSSPQSFTIEDAIPLLVTVTPK